MKDDIVYIVSSLGGHHCIGHKTKVTQSMLDECDNYSPSEEAAIFTEVDEFDIKDWQVESNYISNSCQ